MLDVTLLAAVHEELAPLIAPPVVISLVFGVFFLFLGFVVWSYRDVSNRSPRKAKTQEHKAGPIDEYGHPESH
ncbi:hypothetical protein [Frigoribacterium faeni]|jgi:hypothetical protein|uniref:Uncharacterized protein n=1 Tax=Frigoribacterium faeni TaxID=145483 RepID=A0A7W3JI48_9MICO|nr:hypothetical protein [Frigoribacterium faeni]MBA8813305.1 hypothetical protein [Frigoribacterium faeni]BFF14525.1 hypothetical protein GCM10025699_58280 [Microbacterium flavescens]GEK84596.1 hypothetical protein FFA01_29050 [Frigoribacterium faeni]